MSELEPALSLPILIADDDADDRLLLQMAFAELTIPNPIIFFKDGSEVTAYLESMLPDSSLNLPGLMLLDVNMPRKNGLQVLKEVKMHFHWKQICVCLFSTARTDYYMYEAEQSGADDYLVKPDTYEDLLIVIKALYTKWLQSVIANRSVHPCSMEKPKTTETTS